MLSRTSLKVQHPLPCLQKILVSLLPWQRIGIQTWAVDR